MSKLFYIEDVVNQKYVDADYFNYSGNYIWSEKPKIWYEFRYVKSYINSRNIFQDSDYTDGYLLRILDLKTKEISTIPCSQARLLAFNYFYLEEEPND